MSARSDITKSRKDQLNDSRFEPVMAQIDKDGDTIMRDSQLFDALARRQTASPAQPPSQSRQDWSMFHKVSNPAISTFNAQPLLPHPAQSRYIQQHAIARPTMFMRDFQQWDSDFRLDRNGSKMQKTERHVEREQDRYQPFIPTSNDQKLRTDQFLSESPATTATDPTSVPPNIFWFQPSIPNDPNLLPSLPQVSNRALASDHSAAMTTPNNHAVPQLPPLTFPPPLQPISGTQTWDLGSYNARHTSIQYPPYELQTQSASVSPLSPHIDVEFYAQTQSDGFQAMVRAGTAPAEVSKAGKFQDEQSTRVIATPVSRKKRFLDVKQARCTGCMEDFDIATLIRLPCQCRYCSDCLSSLVDAGCSSAADFPPKCHGQALRISTYGPALKKETSERYKQVEAEFSTQTPYYCAVPSCSAFISQNQIIESDETAVCLECSECTCTRCRMLLTVHAYEGGRRMCPKEGSDVVALRELGEKQDWMQCPACQTMVEKIDGCNHVACNCGVEFCYNCGSFYDEDNLCECQSDLDDGDDDDSLDGRHFDDDEEDEEDAWPDHRRIFDSMGRQKCWHLTTHRSEGELCHGCLKIFAEWQLHSCQECQSELCQECLDDVHDDHIKVLEHDHEDAIWKIFSIEQEQLQLPYVNRAAVEQSKVANLRNHEETMTAKWAPHQIRKKETWSEHKLKAGLS